MAFRDLPPEDIRASTISGSVTEAVVAWVVENLGELRGRIVDPCFGLRYRSNYQCLEANINQNGRRTPGLAAAKAAALAAKRVLNP